MFSRMSEAHSQTSQITVFLIRLFLFYASACRNSITRRTMPKAFNVALCSDKDTCAAFPAKQQTSNKLKLPAALDLATCIWFQAPEPV